MFWKWLLCCTQVLCTSWWNTPRKATWGSTCGRGGRRAWTTPSTPVKSPTSSSPSKTWCPAPTRSPEAWSTSPRRRSAANNVCCLTELCMRVQEEFSCLNFSLIIIPKEIKRQGKSSNVRMLCQVLTCRNLYSHCEQKLSPGKVTNLSYISRFTG